MMRAIQIALLVICIQIGMGIVTESGLFSGVLFENRLTNVAMPANPASASDAELLQANTDVFNRVINALTWGWLTNYFEPFYSGDAATKVFVDTIVTFMNTISGIIIGIALIQFIRNQVSVLGSG